MNNLFEKFPVITYGDDICVNILTKIKFNETALGNALLYYPYTIKEGERPDHIAFNYYGDPRYVWLVYMSNKTMDPYYEWPLDDNSFKQYIINKYGSYEAAVNKISHYRVSYQNDDRMLDQSAYGALTSQLKKYWRPVINENGSTLFYTRKEFEAATETNKVVSINVSNTDLFITGENVQQTNSVGGVIATGNIKSKANTTTLLVRHVEGAFATSNASIANVQGLESRTNLAVSNTSTLFTAIPADEFVYWEPVSYFTYEEEINISRKYIKLIDSAYVDKIEKEIQELL